MGLQVQSREVGRVVIVEAVGRLTLTDGRTRLRDEIHVFAGTGTRRFILNLARVEFIDSYGVGELARTYSVIRQAGGAMKLGGVNPKVQEVLEVSRLTTIFEIWPDESAALQAFEKSG